MSDDWKWNNSSNNAFNKVADFFNIKPIDLGSIKDKETQAILKKAEVSEIQVKRTQDAVQGYKRLWRNQMKMGAMIHGLVRNGMDLILQQRRQESATTKQYAKLVTNTRVLSAKTNTAIQKTYLKGGKEIEKSGKDFARYTGELDDQYQVTNDNAEKQSQQRRISYRERAQKRLTANERPWRNY